MSKSHELLARYLNGDKSVTLNKIKEAEKEEYFNYFLEKWSFRKPLLKIILWPVVWLFCQIREE